MTTKKPVVIPSQITDLYAEIICKEMERPSTTQHSGGASYVHLPLCAVDHSKNIKQQGKIHVLFGDT